MLEAHLDFFNSWKRVPFEVLCDMHGIALEHYSVVDAQDIL